MKVERYIEDGLSLGHRIVHLANAAHFHPRTTKTPDGSDVETTVADFLKNEPAPG